MGKNAFFEMSSGRKVRNGFMGLVVKVANKMQSKTAKSESSETKAAPTGG
jgi:hypothetical protein